MIDLYSWPTPNGWKISIALEEMGLEYPLQRYRSEAEGLHAVLDRRLADREHLAEEYSIADMACMATGRPGEGR